MFPEESSQDGKGSGNFSDVKRECNDSTWRRKTRDCVVEEQLASGAAGLDTDEHSGNQISAHCKKGFSNPEDAQKLESCLIKPEESPKISRVQAL